LAEKFNKPSQKWLGFIFDSMPSVVVLMQHWAIKSLDG